MSSAVGHRGAHPPAAVWGLVALQLLLALGWSLLAPTYRAPDEPQHVDLVLALARGEGYPGAYEREVGSSVTRTAVVANLSPDGTPEPDRGLRFAADAAPPRPARPSFAELAPDEPTGFGNQMPQHPPLYYLLAAGVVRALPDSTAFDVQVWALRVLGALLVAPLPLLAWLAATRVGAGRTAALVAAALPPAIPQLAHIAGAVGNDGLLALTVGSATAGAAAVLGGDLRLRTAAIIAAALGLGLLTKAFALAAPPAVAAAYAVVGWRLRRAGRPPGEWLRPALVALGGGVVLGAWWYVRNLLRYGTPQPEAFPWPDLPADPVVDFGTWLPYALSRFVLRFWGQVGWVEVALPWPLVWVLAALLALAAGAGLVLRRSPLARPAAVVLLLPLAGTAAIVVAGAVSIYVRTGIPAGVQGRYFFPALVGVAVVAGAGGVALLGGRARWLPVGVLLAGLLVQAVAAALVLDHWYGPGEASAVRALLAWAPVPPAVVALLGLAGVVGVLVALSAVVAAARRPARP